MAHGHEDFHRKTEVYITAEDLDLGELAVRLGSIVNFDRRGKVIFACDCEGTLAAFRTGHNISGSGTAVDPGNAKDGSQSFQLKTAASVLAYCWVIRRQPVMPLTRMGFEISFTNWVVGPLQVWEISWYTGSQLLQARITYAKPTGELKMLLPDDTESTIATLPLYWTYGGCFHTLKLVVDFEAEKYVRLSLNDAVYDLSAYDLHVSASAEDPHIDSLYKIWGELAGARWSNIDNWIITKDEPEEV